MKKSLLKTLLVGAFVMVAQSTFAGTYYFYNKSVQFEVVPAEAATVYCTTKANINHTENMTSDAFEGEPVRFDYNICAGYDDLYFTDDSGLQNELAGYKVIHKAQGEAAPTQEEIDAAPMQSFVVVDGDGNVQEGVVEELNNSRAKVSETVQDVTEEGGESHDGVLNGLYVGTAFDATGGAVGWNETPDAYIYIIYVDETGIETPNILLNAETRKQLKNNRVVIEHGGNEYNAAGAQIK